MINPRTRKYLEEIGVTIVRSPVAEKLEKLEKLESKRRAGRSEPRKREKSGKKGCNRSGGSDKVGA